MPLSPFMGVSMMAHLGVIVFHALLGRFLPVRTTEKPVRPLREFIISAFVISFVFGVVIMNAGAAILGALRDDHSTITLAEEHLPGIIDRDMARIKDISEQALVVSRDIWFGYSHTDEGGEGSEGTEYQEYQQN